jgi:hypothetical protein
MRNGSVKKLVVTGNGLNMRRLPCLFAALFLTLALNGCGDDYSGVWNSEMGTMVISESDDGVWHMTADDLSDVTMVERDGQLVTDDLGMTIENDGSNLVLRIRYGDEYDAVTLERSSESRSP